MMRQMRRVVAARLRHLFKTGCVSIDDPVFLPDFPRLMPDQAQELRHARRSAP
jgi:hypothetical protein